jgi:hypothetical protein
VRIILKYWVHREENIKQDTWASGRARNMENKNESGIEGAI